MFYSFVVFSMCAFSSFLSAHSGDTNKPVPAPSQMFAASVQVAPSHPQEEGDEDVLIQDEEESDEETASQK